MAAARSAASLLQAVLERLLQILVGLIINIALKAFSAVAGLQNLVRRARGLPDASQPRPVWVPVHCPDHGAPQSTTAQHKSEASAPAAASGSEDEDDLVAEIPGGAAALAVDDADSCGMSKGDSSNTRRSGAKSSGSSPLMVQALHIPVDAAAGGQSEAWRRVGPYLKAYGTGALASSTLWGPEFTHFFIEGVGSQPYIVARSYNRAIVVGVGDPLAHPDRWADVTRAFVAAFPEATYTHAGLEFGLLLRDIFGYRVNDIGAETNILVQSWAYTKKTRTVRTAARDARAAGVTVREVAPGELTPALRAQLAAVTGDWVAQKSVADQELRVFIRHLNYDHIHLEHGVRLFVAEAPDDAPAAALDDAPAAAGPAGRRQRRVAGFVLADPLWRDGKVTGYVISLNRLRRDAHHGTLKLLYETVFATAKAEGLEVVTFGFAPFFNMQFGRPFVGPAWTELATRFLFRFGNCLYSFQNLAFSKARYGGSAVGDSYKDPNVTMSHVYGATHSFIFDMGMLDQYVLLQYVGFFGNLDDTLFKMVGLRSSLENSLADARTAVSLEGS